MEIAFGEYILKVSVVSIVSWLITIIAGVLLLIDVVLKRRIEKAIIHRLQYYEDELRYASDRSPTATVSLHDYTALLRNVLSDLRSIPRAKHIRSEFQETPENKEAITQSFINTETTSIEIAQKADQLDKLKYSISVD